MSITRNTPHLGPLSALVLVFAAGCDAVTINHGHAQIEDRAEQLAEAYCAVYTSCDCAPLATDALHPEPEQCVAEQRQRIIRAFDAAEAADLEFDQACMDQLLARFGELDCGSWASVQAQFGNPALAAQFGCALYHGEVTTGICTPLEATPWSDCEAGLGCFDHDCSPPISAGGEGSPCYHMSESLDCQAGLVCDLQQGCIAGQQLGEPCSLAGDNGQLCGVELFCSPVGEGVDGVCESLRSEGEGCATDWECHGWCREGVCVDIPAVCLYPSLQPAVE